jgi:LysR family transcriptional activator of glutamate synthase operon
MELRQLRYLVALAEEQHFTRAAQRLHIAQPALSQQIAKLERELGVALVERTTRRMAFTAAGELLLAHARRMVAEEAAARAELDDLAGLRRGHLDVGATQAMGPVDLARLLVDFHRRHPAIELTVREALTVELHVAVAQDELDLAFVTAPPDDATAQSTQIAAEPLVCVMATTHPLAERTALSVADLRDDTFVMFARSATVRRKLDDAARVHGFAPDVGFETSDVTRIRTLVSAGLGVAVLPRSDAETRGPRVRIVPLTDSGFVHSVFVTWRRTRRHSPAARAFLDLTLQARD